jgi:hypothetical protein
MSSATPTVPAARARAAIGRAGLDRVECAVLVALAGLSLAVLAALSIKGRELTGADGMLAADQLQYFTWIKQASLHGLVGNEYDLQPDSRVFLHPGFALSGLLHALGLPVAVAYQVWKPVAVGLAFSGALAYMRRLLEPGGPRHAGLVLALFTVLPASAFVAWTGLGGNRRQYTFDFISGEMWPGGYLWGYLMTAIAVFLMPLVLLAAERWSNDGSRRALALAAAGAFVVCWLQPWQGAALALIVLIVEGVRWWRERRRPRAGALAVPFAVAVPAAYYFLLSVFDDAWKLAGQANQAGSQSTWSWPWWAIALCLAPLAVPAAFAYRLRAPTWQDVAVRAWPPAVLIVYLAPVGTFPYHALQGLSIPLAVLAVHGTLSVWPHPRRVRVVAAIVLLTVPGTIHKLTVAINSIRAAGDPYWVFPDEDRALDALARDPRAGGVLSAAYAGHMIPYRTGREVYVGALSWTPDWDARVGATQDFFEGRMAPGPARGLARRSGARFAFVDCRPRLVRDLRVLLGPLVESRRDFGCAQLYVLRP